jgi:hypothetical protein
MIHRKFQQILELHYAVYIANTIISAGNKTPEDAQQL